MEISSNTTGMPAGLSVATDREGCDHCTVIVKGTFTIQHDGSPVLAEKQELLVYADVYYNDPGTSSLRYECDFVPFKPRADIIVNAHAISPTGKPVKDLIVTLEVASLRKRIRVLGDRRWQRRLLSLRPSAPTPFLTMPLVYERAFGGSDHSHSNPKYHGTELQNPVGVGFHKNPSRKTIRDRPLPNLEDPQHPIRKWSDTPPPVGCGIIGRNWQPRIRYAGTYDDQWLKDRFPFLPEDFDNRYFLSAPPDQQVPFLQGGEAVRCVNMSPEGTLSFAVPKLRLPVVFLFRDRAAILILACKGFEVAN